MRSFTDRHEAGKLLSRALTEFAHREDVIVLALPRGGVPVAWEISTALGLPLDVLVVRKIGAPEDEELALGAIASGGVTRLDQEMVRLSGATPDQVQEIIARERVEVERRELEYRGERPEPDLTDRTVILVDDGMATGSTMLVAVQAIRERHPRHIVVAVPVASLEACALIHQERVECRTLVTPDMLFAVGAWYHDFAPTTDEDVRQLLAPHPDGKIADGVAR
jgi:putative phosphoribosyl transferase